ncbi:MAG: hypothetical protein QG637_1383, partial [Chloroflexota bacterium]|nr:hypothetical protein [Chloroflexota bacterium]
MGDVAAAPTTPPLRLVEGTAALARLAEHLALAAPLTAESCALIELAQGARPAPLRLSGALAAIRSAIPRFSLAAAQAAQALVDLLAAPGASASAGRMAEAYLDLGQAHAARRAGREAAAAAARAREGFAVAGDLTNLARCELVAGEAALAEGRYAAAL